MLRLVTAILPGGSLLIFDTGANTLENKQKIRDQGFQFLTLKAKNVGSYQRYLRFFHHEGTTGNVTMLMVNDRQYIWPKRKKKMAASPTSSSHQSCTMNRCRSKRRSSNEKNNRATYYWRNANTRCYPQIKDGYNLSPVCNEPFKKLRTRTSTALRVSSSWKDQLIRHRRRSSWSINSGMSWRNSSGHWKRDWSCVQYDIGTNTVWSAFFSSVSSQTC